ncbi:MAG: C40 family peptidase [Methylococcaceae bacterium]
MELQIKYISKTYKFISLLYLCSLFITGCSSTPKIAESEPFLSKPIAKEKNTILIGEFIHNSALSQLEMHYKYGGTSPKTGFDCSGLAWYSHKKNGITIPRHSLAQFSSGKRILLKDLRPGDLVFFETYRQGASHVGIYSRDGNFIHALNRNKDVAIQKLANNYYKKRYLGARRYW